jgi:hypothetical protein
VGGGKHLTSPFVEIQKWIKNILATMTRWCPLIIALCVGGVTCDTPEDRALTMLNKMSNADKIKLSE